MTIDHVDVRMLTAWQKSLVIDEADRILEIGFEDEMKQIIKIRKDATLSFAVGVSS